MKRIKNQLIIISKSLATLSKKVEKITAQVDKLQAPKKAVPAKKKVAKKTAAKKAAPAKQVTMLDTVFDVIKRTRKGVTVKQLREKTKLDSKQISGALRKLKKAGKIKRTASKGIYKKGGVGGGRPKR